MTNLEKDFYSMLTKWMTGLTNGHVQNVSLMDILSLFSPGK